jgi:hypothetical protein
MSFYCYPLSQIITVYIILRVSSSSSSSLSFPSALQRRVLRPSSEVLPCHCHGPSFLYCLSASSSCFFCHISTLFLAYLLLSFLMSLPLLFVLVSYLPPSSPGVHAIITCLRVIIVICNKYNTAV